VIERPVDFTVICLCVHSTTAPRQGKQEQLFRRPFGVGMCPLTAALLDQCIKSGAEISPPNPDVYTGEDNQFTTLHQQIAEKYACVPLAGRKHGEARQLMCAAVCWMCDLSME
jgi:hypothetical protein